MKLHDVIVILATAILWLPFPSLTDRFRSRSLLAHYSSPEMGRVWKCWQNYIDLLRGAMGAYVVIRMGVNVRANVIGLDPFSASLPTVILGLGVLFQTVRLPAPVLILAPVFYLSGLTLILPGSLEGAFALLFGWAFSFATKDIRHQLPAMGLALLLAGIFNNNLNQSIALNAAFVLAPPLLALLLNRRLIFLTNESRYARGRSKTAHASGVKGLAASEKLSDAPAFPNT
jgi:hypothetical protein